MIHVIPCQVRKCLDMDASATMNVMDIHTPVVFFSHASGNTERLVKGLGLPATRIGIRYENGPSLRSTGLYVLIVPTYKSERRTFVPRSVKKFLVDHGNSRFLVGVIGTGSRNFGKEFCRAADVVAEKFGVPVVGRIEFSGMTDEQKMARDIIVELTTLDIRSVQEEGEVHVGQ